MSLNSQPFQSPDNQMRLKRVIINEMLPYLQSNTLSESQLHSTFTTIHNQFAQMCEGLPLPQANKLFLLNTSIMLQNIIAYNRQHSAPSKPTPIKRIEIMDDLPPSTIEVAPPPPENVQLMSEFTRRASLYEHPSFPQSQGQQEQPLKETDVSWTDPVYQEWDEVILLKKQVNQLMHAANTATTATPAVIPQICLATTSTAIDGEPPIIQNHMIYFYASREGPGGENEYTISAHSYRDVPTGISMTLPDESLFYIQIVPIDTTASITAIPSIIKNDGCEINIRLVNLSPTDNYIVRPNELIAMGVVKRREPFQCTNNKNDLSNII